MSYFRILSNEDDNRSFEDFQSDNELGNKCVSSSVATHGQFRTAKLILLACGVCACISIAALYATHYALSKGSGFLDEELTQNHKTACIEPIIRKEWRTLSSLQKQQYISAVQYLQTQPSRIGLNHPLYDEFTWVHSRLGKSIVQRTPAFVAWHRYYLHMYENALRQQCGYSGHLTYWDWTLDWKDMTKAPIWDVETGFGGDGNKNAEESVGHGHCVTDGPFANLTVLYYSDKTTAHCLSRGFQEIEGGALDRIFGVNVRPDVVEAVLNASEYSEFNSKLEEGPHLAVPYGVRGDFAKVTAPNDPIFFLHHTQLDRLWWMWQQRDPQKRLWQYGDEATGNSTLDDVFHFEGFVPDIHVVEAMSTESGLLCYRY